VVLELDLHVDPVIAHVANSLICLASATVEIPRPSKRALGISAAKGRLSREIGIPLTRSGRQKRLGAAAGCCVLLAVPVAGAIAAALAFR
jgi:hypothetical protein